MTHHTDSKSIYRASDSTPIGVFVERGTGNYFEYSVNDEPINFCEDFPHKVWVGGGVFSGMTDWRYAIVRKTGAYIVVDEDEYGMPVTEKWHIRNRQEYI